MNVPEKLGVTNINCFHGAWMGNREMLQEVCLWVQKLIWTTISTKIGRKKWDWQRALLGAGEGRLRMESEESAEAPWLIPAPSEWWPLCPWAMGLKMRGPQMWGIPALVKGKPGSGVIWYHGVPLLQQMEPTSFENWTSLLPSATWASPSSPLSLLAFSS